VFVGAMFFLGFFTGVLFMNFQANRIKLMNPHLTQDQMLFQRISKIILQEKPYYSDPPASLIRRTASRIVASTVYHRIVVFSIVLNSGIAFSMYR
jgi:hypothetical protein